LGGDARKRFRDDCAGVGLQLFQLIAIRRAQISTARLRHSDIGFHGRFREISTDFR
jgi:hypothetical protein